MAEAPSAGFVTISVSTDRLEYTKDLIKESNQEIISSVQDTADVTEELISNWEGEVSEEYKLVEIWT